MQPIVVTVTGAAGNIGYAILPRIASGAVFGPHQPVTIKLLEIPPAMKAVEGVRMELLDCAPPLLHDVVCTSDLDEGFGDCQAAFLIGARPRGPGMERADLLKANGPIFTGQGQAIARSAHKDVRVLVVGNPANTNCLIAASNATGLSPRQFHAMTRLDHNRARYQLADKAGTLVTAVKKVTIWGNHSATQYPDAYHAEINGQPAASVIDDDAWIKGNFIPAVQKRGAAIIEARGQSSAASAANAAINHVQSWHHGTPEGDWVSMASPSTGASGAPDGVIFVYPVTVKNGVYQIVEGLELSEFDRQMIKVTGEELLEERAAIEEMLG